MCSFRTCCLCGVFDLTVKSMHNEDHRVIIRVRDHLITQTCDMMMLPASTARATYAKITLYCTSAAAAYGKGLFTSNLDPNP